MEMYKPVYMNKGISIYSKDELPTWDEMYQFYKKNIFDMFINSTDNEIDPYWKYPRELILLALVCNQFNKMIFEDGVDITPLIDKYNLKMFKFLIYPCSGRIIESKVVPPPIYSIPHPETGKLSIFITNDHPRFSIGDFQVFYPEEDRICLSAAFNRDPHLEWENNIVRDAIDLLMKPIVDYFENGIGWKDDNGKLIPYERVNHCQGVGVDPAL